MNGALHTRLVLLVAALCSCSGDARLWVDVRTNLTPGRDAFLVEVDVDGVGQSTSAMRTDVDWGRGYRVASFVGVDRGATLLTVRLLDAVGRPVAERPVLVSIRGDTAITVVVTRDCRGVTCESADGLEACLAGSCVDAACIDGTQPECPPPRCTSSATCSGLGSDCAYDECVAGFCVTLPSACADSAICDVDDGCIDLAPGPCPLPPGGSLEIGRYSAFLPRPTAFATTPTHVFFWTAYSSLATPGSSRVFRADKCGGQLLEVQEPVGQDNRDSGYTIDVDDSHVYFTNQRSTNFPVYRALLTGGEREALTAGQSGVCGLAVDEPRDRVLFARCGERPGIYSVARAGGDVALLFDGAPLRRVVREGDRLAWIDRDPPGLRLADLGSTAPVETVREPTPPKDVVLHGGVPYWLRPLDDATELVRLTDDRPSVVARLGPGLRSLAAHDGNVYVIDSEGPLVIELASGGVQRLPGRGGEHVYADADGLYVSGTETNGEVTQHVVRRYGL